MGSKFWHSIHYSFGQLWQGGRWQAEGNGQCPNTMSPKPPRALLLYVPVRAMCHVGSIKMRIIIPIIKERTRTRYSNAIYRQAESGIPSIVSTCIFFCARQPTTVAEQQVWDAGDDGDDLVTTVTRTTTTDFTIFIHRGDEERLDGLARFRFSRFASAMFAPFSCFVRLPP